jgi:hypothetical protein
MPKKTKRRNHRNGGVVYPRVSKLGSEERTFSVSKGTTLQELLDLAEIDGGISTIKVGNKTVEDFDTPITSSVRIVAIPNYKGGNDESETKEITDFDKDDFEDSE